MAQSSQPLAARMRPAALSEVVGQADVTGDGSPLKALLSGQASAVSVVLFGPPGTGKTSLAYLVASLSGREFRELSAVSAGVKQVREEIEAARSRLETEGTGTILFIDEVHRWSKTQQDAVLPAVENGWVTLIAATTENPSYSVVAPLLSRSVVLKLQPISEQDIITLLQRAVTDDRGLGGKVTIDGDATQLLARLAMGDGRRALTYLEACASASPVIDIDVVSQAVQHSAIRYDADGDQHYDVTSALIKSIRGSDPDAALHYLARMLQAGEDPRFIARRLVILASEDIGMADPQALLVATAASQAVATIGMPEAQLALAQAVVYEALAPKSNTVYQALGEALADIAVGNVPSVPLHLRDAHSRAARNDGHGRGYVYPHDMEGAVATQDYLPEALAGRQYYRPKSTGAEAAWQVIAERLRILRSKRPPQHP